MLYWDYQVSSGVYLPERKDYTFATESHVCTREVGIKSDGMRIRLDPILFVQPYR